MLYNERRAIRLISLFLSSLVTSLYGRANPDTLPSSGEIANSVIRVSRKFERYIDELEDNDG